MLPKGSNLALGLKPLALGVMVIFVLACTQAFAIDKPNIVIIVADDLGYADPGFRGSEIDTPSIDSLAIEGMVLQRFYTAPICSPTRAALMTGRDPMQLGIAYSVILPWDVGGIHPRERLMSETFNAAGYQTASHWKMASGPHSRTVYAAGARF